MTPEEIHKAAVDASERAIEFGATWADLPLGRVSDEDEEAIRDVMRLIASKVGRGSVCDLSYDPQEAAGSSS
jgi:hypothetical protein